MPAPTGARNCSRFRSINAHDDHKRLELRRIGYLAKIQKPYCRTYSQWGSAYKRGGASLRSRSKFYSWLCDYSTKRLLFYRLENSAKTTDIPVSGSAVKNPRLTKEGKTIFCKTDKFVPLIVPGLSTRSGSDSSSTSALQDLSTIPTQERSDELAPGDWCRSSSKTQKQKEKEGWQSRFGRPSARSSWMVGGVHR